MFETNKDYWVPLLKTMRDIPGGQAQRRKVLDWFYKLFGDQVTTSDHEFQENGHTLRWENRVGWARYELVQLGYLDDPAHGQWRITQKALDWLSAHPDATELDEQPARSPKSAAPKRPPKTQGQAPAGPVITLASLERTRQYMPAEEFRSAWGEVYDRLVAEQRVQAITPLDRKRLLDTVVEQVYRIQGFVRGQGNERPAAEDLCDWIYQCYLFGLYREAAVLWPLVDKGQVEPWYFERTKRIALACKAKT
jgi:restriction endonuclease Mrr